MIQTITIVAASGLSFLAGCWFAYHSMSERMSADLKEVLDKVNLDAVDLVKNSQQHSLALGMELARPCARNVIETFGKGAPKTPRAAYLLLQLEHQLELMNLFSQHGPALGEHSGDEFEGHANTFKRLSAELEALKTSC